MTIAVIVPVLGRPWNAQPLADSLKASGAEARLVFVISDFEVDTEQHIACSDTGAEVIVSYSRPPGDWAKKIHVAYRQTQEPYILLGADDLRFHPGWDTEALLVAEATGAGVVGTNDLGNPYVKRGTLATHALVARWYAEQHGTIDEPGKILHEGYWHNWVDAELTETAMSRGLFAFAPRSKVEHMHPSWGKAAMGATYEIALDREHFEEDRRLLNQRRRLWRNHRISGARRARARR